MHKNPRHLFQFLSKLNAQLVLPLQNMNLEYSVQHKLSYKKYDTSIFENISFSILFGHSIDVPDEFLTDFFQKIFYSSDFSYRNIKFIFQNHVFYNNLIIYNDENIISEFCSKLNHKLLYFLPSKDLYETVTQNLHEHKNGFIGNINIPNLEINILNEVKSIKVKIKNSFSPSYFELPLTNLKEKGMKKVKIDIVTPFRTYKKEIPLKYNRMYKEADNEIFSEFCLKNVNRNLKDIFCQIYSFTLSTINDKLYFKSNEEYIKNDIFEENKIKEWKKEEIYKHLNESLVFNPIEIKTENMKGKKMIGNRLEYKEELRRTKSSIFVKKLEKNVFDFIHTQYTLFISNYRVSTRSLCHSILFFSIFFGHTDKIMFLVESLKEFLENKINDLDVCPSRTEDYLFLYETMVFLIKLFSREINVQSIQNESEKKDKLTKNPKNEQKYNLMEIKTLNFTSVNGNNLLKDLKVSFTNILLENEGIKLKNTEIYPRMLRIYNNLLNCHKKGLLKLLEKEKIKFELQNLYENAKLDSLEILPVISIFSYIKNLTEIDFQIEKNVSKMIEKNVDLFYTSILNEVRYSDVKYDLESKHSVLYIVFSVLEKFLYNISINTVIDKKYMKKTLKEIKNKIEILGIFCSNKIENRKSKAFDNKNVWYLKFNRAIFKMINIFIDKYNDYLEDPINMKSTLLIIEKKTMYSLFEKYKNEIEASLQKSRIDINMLIKMLQYENMVGDLARSYKMNLYAFVIDMVKIKYGEDLEEPLKVVGEVFMSRI
ncbi:hypothetical protein LUQ84_002700 [Hamiltosporidium tvaerminnensis]|nr:hypothetical protein LUQ84_002700 [Hamiltosporidium tvaerminnensis]